MNYKVIGESSVLISLDKDDYVNVQREHVAVGKHLYSLPPDWLLVLPGLVGVELQLSFLLALADLVLAKLLLFPHHDNQNQTLNICQAPPPKTRKEYQTLNLLTK